MSILKTKLQKIREQSSAAISVFQKTVSDLALANDEIVKEDGLRVKQIDKLQGERNALASIKRQNTQFINKLNEFLGV